jgi:hypothetical protein
MMTNNADTGIRMLARAAAEFARGELAANREESDRFPFGPFFSTVFGLIPQKKAYLVMIVEHNLSYTSGFIPAELHITGIS